MKIKVGDIPLILLVATLFQPSLVIQYAVLVMLCLWQVSTVRLQPVPAWISLIPAIIAAGLVSYLYNLALGRTDWYSYIFWLFSYGPPFLIFGLMMAFGGGLRFDRIFPFYKLAVYAQTFLLIASALRHERFVVGDPATGTVGDANWVAFHICVIIIFEVSTLVSKLKLGLTFLNREVIYLVAQLLYLLAVLIIPESTANFGLLFITLAALLVHQFGSLLLKGARVFIILLLFFASLYAASNTLVYRRIEDAVADVFSKDIDTHPYLFKLRMYRLLVSGSLYHDGNFLVGSGPATFTSRSSVMRMPEERVNSLAFEPPYFKSQIFEKYISPEYEKWRISKESYGNFASPQTTVISVGVELGVVGLALFAAFFAAIFRSLRRDIADFRMRLFGLYLTFFFTLSLFHLNFWEYPIVAFTYLTLVGLIIKDGRQSRPT